MFDRDFRVQFRLTQKEFQRYQPLIHAKHHDTWSGLVRWALLKYWEANPLPKSDNHVRHELDQTTTPSLFTRAKKKPTRRIPSRRGKSKV